MIQPIMKDIFFLQQKSEPATQLDVQVGQDLQDTLSANAHACVGMAGSGKELDKFKKSSSSYPRTVD